MPRSLVELRQIRSANRGVVGLSGVPGDILGGALAGASVRIMTEFPGVDVIWSPNAVPGGPAEVSGTGSSVSRWVNAHVVRPKMEVTIQGLPVTIDPYKDEANYSGVARFLAWLAGAGFVGSLAWLLVRALSGSRRANPKKRIYARRAA